MSIHYSYIFSDMLLHTLLSVLAVSESEVRGYDLYVLETVYVTLTLTHPHRGHLDIQLVSPHGTISVIGAARRKDKYAQLLTWWLKYSVTRAQSVSPSFWKLARLNVSINLGQSACWDFMTYLSINIGSRCLRSSTISLTTLLPSQFLPNYTGFFLWTTDSLKCGSTLYKSCWHGNNTETNESLKNNFWKLLNKKWFLMSIYINQWKKTRPKSLSIICQLGVLGPSCLLKKYQA